MIFKLNFFLLSLLFTLNNAHPITTKQNNIENEINTIDSGEIDLTPFERNIFGNPDLNTGDLLAKWTPDQQMNPEELGSYLEGDILIPSKINGSRNGLISRSSLWRNGIVPYVIQGSFSSNELELIKKGIDAYHSKTCIKFVPRTYEKDYVAIVNSNSGCWSSVGRIGGRQEINLQSPGCVTKIGTFVHEAMHALGFLHEQNRYERDNYITIRWENIQPSTRINFDKASSATTSGYGVPYDYGSVMHYSAYAFTKNGQPTIVPKYDLKDIIMGQREGMTNLDVMKIRRMYGCDDTDNDNDNEEDSEEYYYL